MNRRRCRPSRGETGSNGGRQMKTGQDDLLERLFGTDDPDETLRRLRTERPVTRIMFGRSREVWLVTRYQDVRALLADPRLGKDGLMHPGGGRTAADQADPQAMLRNMLALGPPDHTRLRRLVSGAFTPRRVAAL